LSLQFYAGFEPRPKADLERQKQVLELFCAQNGWQFQLIEDLGSGLNYNKRGLKRLIKLITDNSVERLVLTHKDRLLRFGSELVFSLCEHFGCEVVLTGLKTAARRLTAHPTTAHSTERCCSKRFKTKLNPNDEQRTLFAQHCGVARWAYNWD